jgi:diguanylate cyclase (GGDEF)-like protein/PAS domain S-box-containing protein
MSQVFVGRAGPFARVLSRIPRRPAVTLTAVLVCLGLIAGLVLVIQVDQRTIGEASARLDRHAVGLAASIDDRILAATRDIRLTRRNAVFDQALTDAPEQLPADDRRAIESVITYVGERYQVDEICLIRSSGQETARWNGGQVAAVADLSPDESQNNPGFAPGMALPDDAVTLTAPYISPDSERWVIGLVTPIVLPDITAGILHFELPVQWLSDELAGNSFGGSSYAFLVNRGGELVDHPEIERFRIAQGLPTDPRTAPFPSASVLGSASWRDAISLITQGGSGATDFTDDAGRSYRASWRPLAESDRLVVAVAPHDELFAEVTHIRTNLLVTVGPLVALIILVSGWFARRLLRANSRLAESGRVSAELAAIVESADDAIVRVGLDGHITTWNEGAARLYGLGVNQAIGRPMADLFPPDRRREAAVLFEHVVAGSAVEHHETVQLTGEGSPIEVSLTFSPIVAGEQVAAVSVVARDIGERKRLERELEHQALHDALTGLPNRALFHDRLDHALSRGTRPVTPGQKLGVLFIDLDDFKLINDTLGHRIGDELLVAVAHRIQAAIRPGDTAARLGGDEFTVLLEQLTDPSAARLVADRILEQLRQPFVLEGHQVVVSASIGISIAEGRGIEPDEILRTADTALYEAKGRGKGRHATYTPEMNLRAWRRLEVEEELRQAIAREEFEVHYQPIVSLAGEQVRAFEALARWRHPVRGLVPPSEFIPLAEQTALIVPIGALVLERALTQVAEWRSAGAEVGISVNVSAREVLDAGYPEMVRDALTRHRVPASALTLEVTESLTVQGEDATAVIEALHKLGVRIALDDFGTGYSSLAYVRQLPVDILKIDRLFVDGLGRDREDTAIVQAAIAFGQALGLDVVGEGIETPEQASRLRELGCREGQGFHYSPPVSAPEAARILGLGGATDDQRDSTAA